MFIWLLFSRIPPYADRSSQKKTTAMDLVIDKGQRGNVDGQHAFVIDLICTFIDILMYIHLRNKNEKRCIIA